MSPRRPFSGPVSVSIAGLTLATVAAASFYSGLSHQLRLARPVTSARVIVVDAAASQAPPSPTLAYLARLDNPTPAVRPPARRVARHRKAEAAAEPVLQVAETQTVTAAPRLELPAFPPAPAESVTEPPSEVPPG